MTLMPLCYKCDKPSIAIGDNGRPLCSRHAMVFVTAPRILAQNPNAAAPQQPDAVRRGIEDWRYDVRNRPQMSTEFDQKPFGDIQVGTTTACDRCGRASVGFDDRSRSVCRKHLGTTATQTSIDLDSQETDNLSPGGHEPGDLHETSFDSHTSVGRWDPDPESATPVDESAESDSRRVDPPSTTDRIDTKMALGPPRADARNLPGEETAVASGEWTAVPDVLRLSGGSQTQDRSSPAQRKPTLVRRPLPSQAQR